MSKRAFASVIKRIEAQKARLAKERDRLDDLISEAQEILEHCDEALGNLDRARDALSQLL